MDRAWVAAQIGVRLATQLADAGMTAADSSGNLKEPIDDALRGLGYAEEQLLTAEPDDAPAFLALARYHTLVAVLLRIGDRFDVGISGDSLRLNQTVSNVEKLLAQAEADVVRLLGSLDSRGGNGVVSLDLNFLTRDLQEACR